MTANEFMQMTLSELTLEQFVFVFFTLLFCTAFAVIIFFGIYQILGLLVDLICYLVCKDKRLGGWWFKRDLCRYIGCLKYDVKHASTKTYYLYYNRLIGAVNALFYAGVIDNNLYLKFSAKGIPSYYDLKSKELERK